jgi:TRAP-type C4-dicarboxylate transport system permease large subunit
VCSRRRSCDPDPSIARSSQSAKRTVNAQWSPSTDRHGDADCGYTRGYACATIAVGSLITATIPPSIGLILYGFLGNVSIGRVFVGGTGDGVLAIVPVS